MLLSQLPDWVAESWSLGALPLLLLLPGLYVIGVARVWRQAGNGKGISYLQTGAFVLGWLTLMVALVSPVDAAASLLFSWHMVQHMLLAFVAAPLLVAGVTGLGLLWSVPAAGRRAFGRWWRHASVARSLLAWLTAPFTVWVMFTLSFWLWHAPPLYEAALRSPLLHALEHFTMLGAAFLFWWLVLQPTGRRRLPHGAAVLFVLATMLQGLVLASLLAFASTPLYASYVLSAQALGVSALVDQQLAGMIMRTPSTIILLVTCVGLFLVWMGRLERLDAELG